MNKTLKLILVAGARPNFVKIAPLIRCIEKYNKELKWAKNGIQYSLVHTGQHYDIKMSEVFFRELELPNPDLNLEVGSASHAVQTANIMINFEKFCLEKKADWVVVVGDVNSTMACTLVASKLGIKVVHVEAGLRSFDRTMPEEINRLVTDALADLLLTPSMDADENLKREGIPPAKVRMVGNIMIDTLVANLEKARRSSLPGKFGLKPKKFIYVTLHRPSNVDARESLTRIMGQLVHLAQQYPVIFPVHPRSRKMLTQYKISLNGIPNLKLLDPIGYHDSLNLAENARLVLTDSGGLQEETTYFKTPCLTLRPNTERPITIEVGTNKLTSLYQLRADMEEILQNRRPSGQRPPLWDGHTAERVLSALLEKS